MPLPIPTTIPYNPAQDRKVQHIVTRMLKIPIAAKTGILYDVMQGYQNDHWEARQVRAILDAHMDQCREILNFTDGGDD